MIIFPNEEALENPEIEKANQKTGNALESRCHATGIAKTNEPLHRNKRLRSWPTETTRKEIYMETMSQETGRPPDRASLEAWREKRAEEFWLQVSKNIPKPEQERVLYEYAVCHIAKMIANTIHLEKMYTTLKPIGQKQWELSSQELRALTDENALLSLMENTPAKTEHRAIPEWIKGAILYLSLQGSKRGAPNLEKPTVESPEITALKAAAEWCLGKHLKVGNHFQNLEETTEIFEKWQTKRKKVNMHLVQLVVEEIPEEEAVPPVMDINGNEIPWNLGWKLLPVLEEEIRELASRVLKNEAALHALSESFKKKVMDRWINSCVRRAYIREHEGRLGVGERWRNRAITLNPIDTWVSGKILTDTPLRLIAKTETAWQLLTEDLPEEIL